MFINELLDVLFWKNIKEYVQFYRELDEKYLPDNQDEYSKQSTAYKLDYIKTKENFINIIENYHINGKPIWQEQDAQYCDMLDKGDILNALKRGSREHGEKHYLMCEKSINGWAYHIDDYTKAVNSEDGINILELASGAGLGTCAVMKNLLPNNRLISIDIDFACVKNIDGIAQFLNLSDRVSGLTANFWFLPFEKEVLDTVCTHYGLDESGEIDTVIKEVSRVLKNGGRFVAIARKNPYDRHKNNMGLFNITESECNPLLKKARLYSGFDNLIELAKKNKLTLSEHKIYERENGHHRILYIFTKQI
jgi:ubiquinone/menaquinone biosynthesis C-methylase UbiE